MAQAAKDVISGASGEAGSGATSPRSGGSPPQLSRRQSSLHDAHAQKLIGQYNQEKERARAKVSPAPR